MRRKRPRHRKLNGHPSTVGIVLGGDRSIGLSVRYLLLDRIVEIEPGRFAVGLKTAAMTEDYFADHFPGFPVVPGVLIVESMAQLSGRLITYSLLAETGEKVLPVLLTIQNARFRRFVRPGDTMTIRTELLGLVDGAGRCRATVKVGDTQVASAELMLGYDSGSGSTVIPQESRAQLEAWAEGVNRTLFAGMAPPASAKRDIPL